ncbi:MAG: transposase [Actinomycetota bacterium]
MVDNGSSHRGDASARRLTAEWPSIRLVHLPVHASWLNQAEIYFSVVQRKVLTPNDLIDVAEIEQRLLAFEHRYEEAARPFEWKFTREDLALLMKRLATKDDFRPAA